MKHRRLVLLLATFVLSAMEFSFLRCACAEGNPPEHPSMTRWVFELTEGERLLFFPPPKEGAKKEEVTFQVFLVDEKIWKETTMRPGENSVWMIPRHGGCTGTFQTGYGNGPGIFRFTCKSGLSVDGFLTRQAGVASLLGAGKTPTGEAFKFIEK